MTERVDSDRLRALAEQATPGPWKRADDLQRKVIVGPERATIVAYPYAVTEGPYANLDYIAACSPDVLLALLAANDRYREALAFYAEPESWKQPSVWSPGGKRLSDAEADGGTLARSALAASPSARSGGDPG